MWGFIICIFVKDNSGDQINESEVNGTYCTHGVHEKYLQVSGKNTNGKRLSGRLHIYGDGNVKTYTKIWCEDMNWIQIAEN
jgi:hypothetical protein